MHDVAALVADRSRCAILTALCDGRALPASRLAAEAGVSAATASSHLAKLTGAGLITVEAHGRHRYYRLAGPEVARLVETLQQFSSGTPVRSLREGTRAYALREARTCYDHLAGRLGVEVMASLLAHGYLTGGDGSGWDDDIDYVLTPRGDSFVADFGIAVPERRRLIRHCVDWSEQRHHLAGALGRGFLDRFFELDWIRRTEATRALRITPAGRAGFRDVLGVELDQGAAAA
jgi:DNA-binding transcriptional ArsR family regulator